MIDKLFGEMKKDGSRTIIRGMAIAFSVDIFCRVFGVLDPVPKYFLMLILIVATTPGMGLVKRK